DWQGYIPFEHLPESHNPQRGYVASANQRQTGNNYPYAYRGSYPDWRGRYINRKLTQLRRGGQREMKELQLDAHSILAEELMPLLLARINRNALTGEARGVFQLLADWDYTFRGTSRAATFFERWRRRVYELTTDEIKRKDGYLSLSTWRWIELLRQQPEHPIFDIVETESKETAAILTQRAFDELMEDWPLSFPEWSEERNTHIPHLAQFPGFGSELLEGDGHFSAPNAITGGHGPSWRMVVELGDFPRAWGILPGGPSGNPGSPFFAAGVEEWNKGRYFSLDLWTDEAEARSKAAQTLTFSTNQGLKDE
ncbi:MAG: penicillin acylase family protein, partial [Bacteroidota bacterium]